MAHGSKLCPGCVVGVDLGDKRSSYCVLDGQGTVLDRGSVVTSRTGFRKRFKGPGSFFVIEAGTHSRWVQELLEELQHRVVVANARQIPLIYSNRKKNDASDAENLARLGRLDTELLAPVQHRSGDTQADLASVKARDALVRSRADLVNHVRGTLKSWGIRIARHSAPSFPKKVEPLVPPELAAAVAPTLEIITELNHRIRRYDDHIKALSETRYPETALFREVQGVGPVTSLSYLLILEDPKRFHSSRAVGHFLGLAPRLDQSGESQPQLRITKAGNTFLRRLMVTAANYILGPFAEDSDLRRWGLKIAQRGGKNAKRRAVVAVARKLSVLLHRLWLTGEIYDPLYQQKRLAKTPGGTAVSA